VKLGKALLGCKSVADAKSSEMDPNVVNILIEDDDRFEGELMIEVAVC